jgi:hypothetical protein
MMSKHSKRELVEVVHPRYLKATKAVKQQIMDEFIAATGYHRKYANRLLKHGLKPRGYKRSGRRKVYQGEVVKVLEQIWEICGRICSKRLHPFLPEIVTVLERNGEIQTTQEIKHLLLRMSRSSIDRCLQKARFEKHKGLSTTKPGTLLKKAIPVRTWHDWDENLAGFLEMDLVAHCGSSAEGQFLYTLTATDVSTGWTECFALPNKTQLVVSKTISGMRPRLPFPLLGIDSDNGSEFINDLLYRYCLEEKITFTRSRPYRKNDQAHVEQKNWSVVRHTVGYDRLESEEEQLLLDEIYADLRFYVNFFQPVLKLGEKIYVDGKGIKKYDQATTPYRRVLASANVALVDKAKLSNLYFQLNPVVLRNRIDLNVGKLWKIAK